MNKVADVLMTNSLAKPTKTDNNNAYQSSTSAMDLRIVMIRVMKIHICVEVSFRF